MAAAVLRNAARSAFRIVDVARCTLAASGTSESAATRALATRTVVVGDAYCVTIAMLVH
jgi:hypothetical protein